MPLFMAFREDFPDIWRKWIAPFHADAGLLTPYDVTREALGRLDIWSLENAASDWLSNEYGVPNKGFYTQVLPQDDH